MGVYREIQRQDGVGRVVEVTFTIPIMRGNVRYDVWLEPAEREDVRGFLASLPQPRPYVALSPERWPVTLARDVLDLPGKIGEKLLYIAQADLFTPRAMPEVQKLDLSRPEHRQAIQRSDGGTALYAELNDECDGFGIISGGRIVSYATFRTESPMGALMAGIWTEPGHRHEGYGKAVATAATAEILKTAKTCLYEVSPDNEPSVRICVALGYRLSGRRYQCGHFAGESR